MKNEKMRILIVGMDKESVSNLITDMTVAGASLSEIARVVEHSKVVIDAEKNNPTDKKY